MIASHLSGYVSAYCAQSRISGTDIWAIMLLSIYSTAEWIILSRCTTTSILSAGTPNKCTASMTSKPLFISVALSMVIFAPIFHVGCANACLGVISLSCEAV